MSEEVQDRTLAQAVKVLALRPIEDADKIELAQVLGWQVVVQKGQFRVGELAVYFSIGAVLDKTNPNTSFLEGKVLKTRKIRGAISQGLLGELGWLSSFGVDPGSVKEGDDLTVQLKVVKYIESEESDVYQMGGSAFPPFVPKTDEVRVQDVAGKLPQLENHKVVITQKYDGTSVTYVAFKNEFIVCSRNNSIKPDPKKNTSHYFQMCDRYDIEKKLISLNRNLALQGEIIGPKISGNRHKVKELDLFIFNVYDIDNHRYLPFSDVLQLTTLLGLKTVLVIHMDLMKPEWLSVSALLDLADSQKYETGAMCEGLVVKTEDLPRRSFKVISNKYLLKYNL